MHLESYCGFFRRLAVYRRTAGSSLELSMGLREISQFPEKAPTRDLFHV